MIYQGAPASVQIFELANVSQAQPVARRGFFKSNTAQMSWNKGSTGVLVLAQSDVDKTNQSYYGERRLHFLTSDGRHEGSVPLSTTLTLLIFSHFLPWHDIINISVKHRISGSFDLFEHV